MPRHTMFVETVLYYENVKVWFTSDTHFSHGNIIKYCNRPFLTEADEKALADNGGTWHRGAWKGEGSAPWRITREAIDMMDNKMIDEINEVVGKNDVLWHLGDFSMFNRKDHDYYGRCKRFRDRIKCDEVNIVWGNHDNPCVRDLFNEAHNLVGICVNGQNIALCHYALAIWDKNHRSSWHLYGHSHGQAEEWFNKNMPGRRAFDAGVDYAYKQLGKFRPWSLSEVKEVMANRDGFTMDHHIPRNSKAPEEGH